MRSAAASSNCRKRVCRVIQRKAIYRRGGTHGKSFTADIVIFIITNRMSMRGHLRHRQRYIFISTDRAQVVTGSHAGSHAAAEIR